MDLGQPPPESETARLSWGTRLRYLFIGPPRDLQDRSLYHHISLIAFLAWVGLGADGLSSSAYGPEEAFKQLGAHGYLAIGLALLMAMTVLVISAGYSRIIEQFPHGGGGYVVATKLLGRKAGVVSGSALLVDYVLTITVSIAAAGDALFSLLPAHHHRWKLPVEVGFVVILLLLNLRGVKESVIALTPIFLLFVITHVILIAGGILAHAGQFPETLHSARTGFSGGVKALGMGGLALLFVRAFSLGGGTYTGIEAVSNGLAIMREPRVRTAKRTMLYMGTSLAFTASGLLFCYLLWHVTPVEGKTMNAVLTERFIEVVPLGKVFLWLTLVSEGALLVVAAQAGFVDGPRVLANMAIDSWMPRRFAAFSDRLTTQNGIVLMGLAALAALLFTKGSVDELVVMYSINVFLTFSLSMLAMLRHTWQNRAENRLWGARFGLFLVSFLLCVTILVITVIEKFMLGGWITLLVTGVVIILCLVIRWHYDTVTAKLSQLYRQLTDVPASTAQAAALPDRQKPVAAILVAGYGGLGLHTFLSIFRGFPSHFKGVVFVSVGVIDSQQFKGEGTVEALKSNVAENLKRYVEFARSQGVPVTSRMAIGTDAVLEAEKLCLEVAKEFPQVTFFAGKVLFEKEKWYQNLLHNETAMAIQKRLQWAGKMVVVVPARLS
ncbi:MAG TPA: APC family permease [Planctomycetota bacterium]|nr:APC family permease [Planctomycetota bacterium]